MARAKGQQLKSTDIRLGVNCKIQLGARKLDFHYTQLRMNRSGRNFSNYRNYPVGMIIFIIIGNYRMRSLGKVQLNNSFHHSNDLI